MNKQQWLSQIKEDILEPQLEICDPHHHLWDHPNNRYMFDELMADLTSGHNVQTTVYMECGSMYRADGPQALRPVGETEFVNGVAEMSASGLHGNPRVCASIVGFADLADGNTVEETLDGHINASSRFVGIRHASGWDANEEIKNSHTKPTEGLLGNRKFRSGFAELAKRNLVFDAWLYHPQIPELTDLAHSFPEQPIVFDHFGGPLGIGPYAGKRDEIFKYWKGVIAKLAECDNVFAKLGGLVMPVNGFGFHKRDRPAASLELAEATREYYLYMIEQFGPKRCMFESNFPVDKASCSYAVLWNSFKRITSDFSDSEKAALYRDTAIQIYRVN